jgi:hypothetical protein
MGCPGNDERRLWSVYQHKKQRPEEIAGNIHKMVDIYGMKTILMDKTGSMGIHIAELCSKDMQLIDGTWQKRQPIYIWDHPDARNGRAHIILTLPRDERILIGVMGPRYDSTISSEQGLKNTLHLTMKDKMQNGKFFAPKLLKDEDYYNSERGEIMDNILESLSQFPKIDRKKTADGKNFVVDTKGNWMFTRPAHDDGAYSIIYANYAANIHYRMMEVSKRSDGIPFLWGGDDETDKMRQESTHQILLPRL